MRKINFKFAFPIIFALCALSTPPTSADSGKGKIIDLLDEPIELSFKGTGGEQKWKVNQRAYKSGSSQVFIDLISPKNSAIGAKTLTFTSREPWAQTLDEAYIFKMKDYEHPIFVVTFAWAAHNQTALIFDPVRDADRLAPTIKPIHCNSEIEIELIDGDSKIKFSCAVYDEKNEGYSGTSTVEWTHTSRQPQSLKSPAAASPAEKNK